MEKFLNISKRPTESIKPGPSVDSHIEVSNLQQPEKWTSLIWKHFIKKVNSDTKKTVSLCKYCNTSLKIEHGNTSSMARHLQGKHHEVYVQFEMGKKNDNNKPKKRKMEHSQQPTIAELSKAIQPWAPDNENAIGLTKSIGEWLADSMHPYSLVEEAGFIRTMKIAEPRYKIPCSTTFSRNVIPDLAKEVRQNINLEISSEKAQLASISLTTDLWTSRTNQSYMAVTGHFIRDCDFTMQSICLGQYNIKGQHSGENIAKQLDMCLQEWHLDSLTVPIFVVTDNARNILSAVKQTRTTGLTCFAHSLQLVIKNAKNSKPATCNMLAKARSIVGHFKHSPQDSEKLKLKQLEMGLVPKKVIQDVDTRWNSEYLMLNRLLEIKEPLSLAFLGIEKDIGFTNTEWISVKNYVDILKPFASFTEEISANRMPTRSMIVPVLAEIQEHLNNYIESHFGETGVQFAKELIKEIKTRFPLYTQNNDIDVLSTIVDPRFKDAYIPHEQKKVAVGLLKKELNSLINLDETTGENQNELDLYNESLPSTANTMWATLEKLKSDKRVAPPTTQKRKQAEREIEIYMEEPLLDIRSNPLKWWSQNIGRYPTMKTVVKKYLSIPATEVASERIFSAAGNIVTERRENLLEKNVEHLVFLSQNLKRKRNT